MDHLELGGLETEQIRENILMCGGQLGQEAEIDLVKLKRDISRRRMSAKLALGSDSATTPTLSAKPSSAAALTSPFAQTP